MATTSTLQLTFGTASGNKTWKFKYVDSSASTANIKAVAQAMIDNGSVFPNPPLTIGSGKIVTTEETNIDLS